MPVSGTPKEIIHEEMGRYKRGTLHSGPDKYGHLAKSRAQAVAIALSVARRKGRAMGGPNMAPPWYIRSEARSMAHVGPVMSSVAGRTDHIPTNVPAGSYILPADHVSHIGQNNTAAGFARLNSMFSSGPFGITQPKMARGAGAPRPPGMPRQPAFAPGGVPHGSAPHPESVPVMLAGGEYVVHPQHVAVIGREAHGDPSIDEDRALDYGHQVLDRWVLDTRAKHKKTLAKLPGPAK